MGHILGKMPTKICTIFEKNKLRWIVLRFFKKLVLPSHKMLPNQQFLRLTREAVVINQDCVA